MLVTAAPPAPEVIALADQRVVLHRVSWSQYELMLAIRGEAPVPRMAYLRGELELMSPSRERELIKSVLSRLVDAAAAHLGIDLWPVGSWTVRSAPRERGIEPDECWTVGDARTREAPDLALEVVWTRAQIDKLEIYRGLGVREVWVWQDDTISVHLLRGDRYEQASHSEILPGLDVALLGRLARKAPREALAELRAHLAS